MLSASRSHLAIGLYDVVLGCPENECLEVLRALTLTKSVFHFSRFIVGEIQGERVAAATGYDPQGEAIRRAAPALNGTLGVLGYSVQQRIAIERRSRSLNACMARLADDAWTIECVATVPIFRRQGFARQVLDGVIAEGRKTGLRRVQVRILLGNRKAQALYEGLGFSGLVERQSLLLNEVLGCSGTARLSADIG
jgi:ribosomal protein S18 acetylase RimI-like enzyme